MSAAAAPCRRSRPFWKDAWLPVLGGLVVAIASTGLARAYWTAGGTGGGSGHVTTLAAPTLSSATPGSGKATLIWTEVTPPGSGSVSYYVLRDDGSPAGNCPTPAKPTSVLTCTDVGLSLGTHKYTVTVVYRSWTARSSSATVAIVTVPTAAFSSGPALGNNNWLPTLVSGSGFNAAPITISWSYAWSDYTYSSSTAADGSGNFAWNGLENCVDSSNVYHTTDQTVTVTATDGTQTAIGTGILRCSLGPNPAGGPPGPASKLAFTQSPVNTVAGVAFATQPRVTVQDQYGNTVTSSNASVTIAIGNNPGGGTLSGTTTVTAVNGVATFSNLSIDKAGTGYTLTAASSPLTGVTSGTFSITAGTPTKLAFTAQPGGGASSAAWANQPSVTVQDAGGNTVTIATDLITLAITTPGGATLTCTPNPKAAVAGLDTFVGCAIDKAGTYTLTATASGLTDATSGTFNITAGAPSKLAFTQSPGDTVAGVAFASQPQVTVQDQYGNTITSSTVSVTVAIGTNPGGGTLSGTKTVAAVNGLATFSNLSIDHVGTGYMLTAASTGLTIATSSAFNITPGALDSFTITTQATPTAGTPFSVSITAYDAYGNTKTDYTDSRCLIFSGPGDSPNGTAPIYPAQGSCAAGQSAVTFTNGVASANMTLFNATPSTLDLTASTTLTATDVPTGKSCSTNPFNVDGTNNETKLRIIPELTTQTAGQTNDLTVVIGDEYGNPTDYTGDYTLVFSGASRAPGGTRPTVAPSTSTTGVRFGRNTTITFTNGVSKVDAQGRNGVMRLYAAETANIGVRRSATPLYTSDTVAVTVLGGTINTFTVTNPGTQIAGNQFNVSISLTDIYGNGNVGTRCLTFSGPANSPDGTPPSYPTRGSCAAGQSEVNFTGAPTYVPITLYRAANPTNLTATDITSTLVRTTASFAVNPGAVASLSMTAATATPTAGAADALTINAHDAYGNDINGAVNLTFSGAGSIGTYNPTMTNNVGTAIDFGNNTAITFTNGVSTAGVMRLYKAETANIVVSDGSGHGASFSVTVTPGGASKLAFTQSPGDTVTGVTFASQPQVTVQDQYGNTITSSTVSITVAIGTNPGGGTLSGTKTVAAVNGLATFSNLSIDHVGTGYMLTAASTGLTIATSSAFNITAGAPSKLAFTQSPGNTVAGVAFASQPTVTVQDADGNTVTTATTSITLTITTPGGSILTCTANPKDAFAGVDAFAGCNIDKAGTYTLTATGGGYTSAVSNSFTISANISQGKPVTCSSIEAAAYACAYAVDGNPGQRWSSAFSDPQWIYVDLGQSHSITQVVLMWETAYGRSFQIQTSNNATSWTTIYSTTAGTGGTQTLAVTGTGRYVRMYGTARGTQWGYSLWEFQVYGG